MNDKLLNYYKVVRGFSGSRNFILEEMRYGFVDSRSIDNIHYRSEIIFKKMIDSILLTAKTRKTIAVLTSHQINSADWGITTERLEYVLKKGKKNGVKFLHIQGFTKQGIKNMVSPHITYGLRFVASF